MPGITRWFEVEEPAILKRFDPTFTSPDCRFRLQFHSGYEWHMGADGWKVSLFAADEDITDMHPLLIPDPKGYRLLSHLQPWSFDSSTLALSTWGSTIPLIYNVNESCIIPVSYIEESTFAYQWSPSIDRLLVELYDSAILLDRSGAKHGVAHWPTEMEYRTPNLFWLPSGKYFAQLGRPTKKDRYILRFFQGSSGLPDDICGLDPFIVFPYDDTRYYVALRIMWRQAALRTA